MYPGGIRTRNPRKRAAANTCYVLNIISIVYVAVHARQMQGLAVGWGYNIMFHQLVQHMFNLVFK
jgi:hypothetical protein